MPRQPRILFPGATYHVVSRGNRQAPIFLDDADRYRLLDIVSEAMSRFDARAIAYCLMGNHYHFVLRTQRANLPDIVQRINGIYAQAFNRRHEQTGHLFQGRFRGEFVGRDEYLLELCRYVELNPVRAGLEKSPLDWRWSSYRAHVGRAAPPGWLDTAEVDGLMLGRDAMAPGDRRAAISRYEALVACARDPTA
jgi:putative transposase